MSFRNTLRWLLLPLGMLACAAQATVPYPTGIQWIPSPSYTSNGNSLPEYSPVNGQYHPQSPRRRYIVIHTTEGSAAGTIAAFQNPSTYKSAHYLVAQSGTITKLVDEGYGAWHTGDDFTQDVSIGVEHEGYANQPNAGLNEAQLQRSAQLVAAIASANGIPVDQDHIIGHVQVPRCGPYPSYCLQLPCALGNSSCGGRDGHYDPGVYFPWAHYMALVRSYSPAPATCSTNVLQSGATLTKGMSVFSCDGTVNFAMQSDGNLVVYHYGIVAWNAGTGGRGYRTVMQTDGNLVIYDSVNNALFVSGSGGHPGATLNVQTDGNVVIYPTSGAAVWNLATL